MSESLNIDLKLLLFLLCQAVSTAWLLYLTLRRPRPEDFKAFSASEIAEFKRRCAILEGTWDDTYAKLRKLVGRMDKNLGIEEKKSEQSVEMSEAEQKIEVMRRIRSGA